MKVIPPTTPIWQLTVEQLIETLKDNFQEKSFNRNEINNSNTSKDNNLAYGLKGLAKLLGCSVTHASRLKKTGMFDKAITQYQRTIIIDKEKVLEILNQNQK